jgi:hypothetical protein
MNTYKFEIEVRMKGLGYVYAETLEEAREKIELEEWQDIYDQVDEEYGEIYKIELD